MKGPFYYIHTLGCQMNVYDSDWIAVNLEGMGYAPTSAPAQAAVIVLNTCAVRAKAEQKAFSFLGRLAGLKRDNPEIVIAVGGCVAQQEGRKILRRVPHVDLVFGTKAIGRLPDLIARVAARRCQLVDIDMSTEMAAFSPGLPAGDDGISRFVTIMQGCENFCTYCVVPYVRGAEVSRSPDRIVDEIQQLVDNGVREVTLLGQNVNSYGKKEKLCSFVQLLERVNRVAGLLRIRFTTSHPKDFSDDLIDAFSSIEKVCHHIHLPVQSGSDRILKRMNRGYTRDAYLGKVEKLRARCRDVAMTSDLIVGFPGETEQDFHETMDLVERVGFDGIFAFKYSDRPRVPAARFSGKIPEAEKNRRLQRLLHLQNRFTLEKNQAMVGQVHPVLMEGRSRKPSPHLGACDRHSVQWTGRTTGNKIVHFIAPGGPLEIPTGMAPGMEVSVHIERALSHSLWGKWETAAAPTGHCSKGVDGYAA